MMVIDVVNIPCMVKTTERDLSIKWFDGTIKEIGYNKDGKPFTIVVEFNNKSKRINPKFINNRIISHLKNKRVIEVFLDADQG